MSLLNYFSKELVDEFIEVYARRPYKHNKWGSKFMNSFFLYCYAKTIQPDLIVELGTYQGQTTWLLEQACPKIEIYSFDISHWKLKKKTEMATYFKCDWNDMKWGSDGWGHKNSMIFIDDHVNQMQRLSEAEERGFKHIFFDDNIPLDKINSQPNLPTLCCYGIGKVLPTNTFLTYVTTEERSDKWVWRD